MTDDLRGGLEGAGGQLPREKGERRAGGVGRGRAGGALSAAAMCARHDVTVRSTLIIGIVSLEIIVSSSLYDAANCPEEPINRKTRFSNIGGLRLKSRL